jgi:hypothetical protein
MKLKFIWPPEYEEELRQASYQQGYQQGYEAMRQYAIQAINSYYSLVFNIVKIHNEKTNHLELGPIPAIDDPKLESYLRGVTTQVMVAYAMVVECKKRIAELDASLLTKDGDVKYLQNCVKQANTRLDQDRSQAASVTETELKEALAANKKLQTRIKVLESVVTVAQNALDRQGNNTGK